MPVALLNEAERQQFSRFPDDIPHDDLSAYFTLSSDDLVVVKRHRGAVNQLGFALQLGALRYLGFIPDELNKTSPVVVLFVAAQLHLAPDIIQTYGHRIHTRTDHSLRAQKYLSFRKATPEYLQTLSDWLTERALSHDKPMLLVQQACEQLRRQKIVRPGISIVERLVANARAQAQEVTYRLLLPLLTPSRCAWLDAVLEPDREIGKTPLVWLCGRATSNSARQILVVLEKLKFLEQTGVADWDLSMLNPNRLKFLAQIGRKASNQYLQRAPYKRRYQILVAFLHQALLTLTDEVVEMFDQCLWDCYTDAKKDVQDLQQKAARTINEKLRLFRDLGWVLLDDAVADDAVRKTSFKKVAKPVSHRSLIFLEEKRISFYYKKINALVFFYYS